MGFPLGTREGRELLSMVNNKWSFFTGEGGLQLGQRKREVIARGGRKVRNACLEDFLGPYGVCLQNEKRQNKCGRREEGRGEEGREEGANKGSKGNYDLYW